MIFAFIALNVYNGYKLTFFLNFCNILSWSNSLSATAMNFILYRFICTCACWAFSYYCAMAEIVSGLATYLSTKLV